MSQQTQPQTPPTTKKFTFPQLDGHLYRYDCTYPTDNQNAAFTNNIPMKKAKQIVILLGGLGDTFLSAPLAPFLNEYCTERGMKFIYPQFRSMPNYWIYRIGDDVEDLRKVIVGLCQGEEADEKAESKELILIGHSTGCQVAMLYLEEYCKKQQSEKKMGEIKSQNDGQILQPSKVILQAPVSDVEYEESVEPSLGQFIEGAKKHKFIEYGKKFWLSERFLSVFERNGKEDLFSTYLPDEHYESWLKRYADCEIFSIASGKDRFVLKSNKEKLKKGCREVFQIEGASHSLWEKVSQEEFGRILDIVVAGKK